MKVEVTEDYDEAEDGSDDEGFGDDFDDFREVVCRWAIDLKGRVVVIDFHQDFWLCGDIVYNRRLAIGRPIAEYETQVGHDLAES